MMEVSPGCSEHLTQSDLVTSVTSVSLTPDQGQHTSHSTPAPPVRRSSCRDYRDTINYKPGVKRTGSLQVKHQPSIRTLQQLNQESRVGRFSDPRLNVAKDKSHQEDLHHHHLNSHLRPPLPAQGHLVRHASDRLAKIFFDELALKYFCNQNPIW